MFSSLFLIVDRGVGRRRGEEGFLLLEGYAKPLQEYGCRANLVRVRFGKESLDYIHGFRNRK